MQSKTFFCENEKTLEKHPVPVYRMANFELQVEKSVKSKVSKVDSYFRWNDKTVESVDAIYID